MATFISNVFYFFLAFLIFIFISISSLQLYYDKAGPSNQDKLLVVSKGQSVSSIAINLKDLNLIENRVIFMIAVRLNGLHDKIKFGEYMIPRASSIREIIDKLVSGVSAQYRITIPEGLSTSSVIDLINKDMRIKGQLIKTADEGALAPNTYSFDITTNKEDLFLKMKSEQNRILNLAWNKRASDLPLKSAYELLILASIVEKEAGDEQDKRKVASVFLNRLKKKMRLQSDPTVVFSLTKGKDMLNRELTKSDLKIKSPFNTYKIDGLPPSPICNPSKSSIYAVANPIETDFLYFVANGEGGHNFSKNLKQHNIFVKEFRTLKKKK